jgi:2-oxo-4-hydroxy-4-carboxy-5-ureidoimidazoline decarboxylase
MLRCPALGGTHGVSPGPIESLAEVIETSDTIWEECDVDDYLEAFTQGHPKHRRCREPREEVRQHQRHGPVGEQKGVEGADLAVIEKPRRRQYHLRGEVRVHLHRVNATGKSAGEMLAMLEARMKNDPKDESPGRGG